MKPARPEPRHEPSGWRVEPVRLVNRACPECDARWLVKNAPTKYIEIERCREHSAVVRDTEGRKVIPGKKRH